ncbi:DUF2919 domain-containing protein [Vibrio sinensis]|uniref:DUF2919 domain-containing protein n=1 Tax=Vibrio sinensis TaxID=2302434 RepID=A0A3A6QE07_9VIBR|nr:DUF2919 domain-containing protein [Vibrio sinensis]RJX67506.1 DUF2919 domain-containing protein [Vibrio sinensis]
MRYTIENYDKHGFLKAPIWLWLGWGLLAKAWIVFVVAGASRDSGSKILTIVYPDHDMLYLGLMMGLPSLALMWMISLRTPERGWANRMVSWGKPVTLLTTALHFLQSGYHVYLRHGEFSWLQGIVMLMLLWFGIYVYNSQTVADCFRIPQIQTE